MKTPTYFDELESLAKDLSNYNESYKSLPDKKINEVIQNNESDKQISPQAQKIINELKKGNLVFLTGAAGTGKSYLTKKIISAYPKNSVAVLASTGIAAINIGGQTLHSFFKLGICDTLEELKANDKEMIKSFYGNNKNAFINKMKNRLKNLDLIIIDEVSMLNKNLIDMVFYRFEQTECYPSVLFVGDFFQLPPVKNYGFAFESINFKLAKPMLLTKIKRQNEQDFQKLLNAVRLGIKEQWVIDELYKFDKQIEGDFEGSHLVATNREAFAINHNKLMELKGQMYKSTAKVIEYKNERELEKFWAETQAERILRFKVGAVVMFIINNPADGYMNGELGVITKIENKKIYITKLSDGKEIKISKKVVFAKYEYVYNKYEDELEKEVVVAVEQLPFKLAFAITTHKSQGLTLDKVLVDAQNIFTDAQLYVGLSRARTKAGLTLKNFHSRLIMVNEAVKNYYENTNFEILD